MRRRDRGRPRGLEREGLHGGGSSIEPDGSISGERDGCVLPEVRARFTAEADRAGGALAGRASDLEGEPMQRRGSAVATAVMTLAALAVPRTGAAAQALDDGYRGGRTATPIEHLVVIFQENVSFDHYFGTYPHAANTDGTPFTPAAGTPGVNGLEQDGLLTSNPNGDNPQRLTPAQAVTCDQDHDYTAEQQAFNGGAMDRFIPFTNVDTCTGPQFSEPGLVMDYYDGNTVTALWNYAQRFAMSDNSYDTNFGPSTPGALHLISGQTGGGGNHAPTRRPAGLVAPGPGTPAGAHCVRPAD